MSTVIWPAARTTTVWPAPKGADGSWMSLQGKQLPIRNGYSRPPDERRDGRFPDLPVAAFPDYSSGMWP